MPDKIPTFNPLKSSKIKRHDKAREEANAFYSSKAWRVVRRMYLQDHPLCERCSQTLKPIVAVDVHHKQDRRLRPDLALDTENLEALCKSCHSTETNRRRCQQ